MSIDQILSEIKKTEVDLKSYSYSLKKQEECSNQPDFQDFLLQLEEKAEYLFELKKRYNNLYRKLNTIE